jgi:molybdenum cofactor biosynthesis enzyme MoaA
MNMQTSGTNLLIDPQGRRIDYVRLSLSTNAVLLASQAEALRSAGIEHGFSL